MLDHKRAIKGLEHCTAWAGLSQCQPKIGDDCPYDEEADCKLALMQDALSSLKEMEAERLEFIETIAKLVAENEVLKKSGIVRCKDCVDYQDWGKSKICMRLGSYYGDNGPDWYCADGKGKCHENLPVVEAK